MRQRLEQAAPLVPQALAAYQAKLADRLREALGSADDDRVRAELAVFASKVDVDEELTRLRAHMDETDRTLKKGGAAGKRLDFIAQELNRVLFGTADLFTDPLNRISRLDQVQR